MDRTQLRRTMKSWYWGMPSVQSPTFRKYELNKHIDHSQEKNHSPIGECDNWTKHLSTIVALSVLIATNNNTMIRGQELILQPAEVPSQDLAFFDKTGQWVWSCHGICGSPTPTSILQRLASPHRSRLSSAQSRQKGYYQISFRLDINVVILQRLLTLYWGKGEVRCGISLFTLASCNWAKLKG